MAIEYDDLTSLLSKAASVQSNAYIKVRTEIVNHGTNAIPLLVLAAVDKDLSWQQRLAARICYERIERGEDIEALRRYDWREHPNFNVEWQRNMAGPGRDMSDLAVSRMRELGFWYYYLEITWKQTREWSLVRIHRINENWIRWCRTVLKGQPEEMYLWLAIEERLDADPALETYDANTLYTYVRENQQINSVPVLVKTYHAYFKRLSPGRELYPGWDAEIHERKFGPIMSFANSSHADMLDKYIDDHPDMSGLKPKLEEVRARPPHTPPHEPPFRLGTTAVKIP